MGEMRWPKLGHWGDLGGRLGWGTSHEYNSMLLAQAGLTGQVRVWDDPMSSPRRGHDSPPLLCSAAARGVGIHPFRFYRVEQVLVSLMLFFFFPWRCRRSGDGDVLE